MCVCVCVCEREREPAVFGSSSARFMRVCVCVCVFVCEFLEVEQSGGKTNEDNANSSSSVVPESFLWLHCVILFIFLTSTRIRMPA